MPTLAEMLARETREGELYDTLPDGRLRCYACGHCCPAAGGRDRRLQGPLQRGRTAAACRGATSAACSAIRSRRSRSSTPIRARSPTASACSAATCTAATARTGSPRRRCAIRRPSRRRCAPRRRRSCATRCAQGARVIVSTYNEPLITSEWAVAIFKEARAAGLATGFVSNGNGTPQVLDYLRPWVDLYKVDLKSFDDRHYRELGGRLAADPRHDPPAARDGLLGRDRHAAHSRLQRLARRARRG